MIVYLKSQPLIFEFGFKGLIILNENLDNSDKDLSFWLYCGLLKYQPDITMDQCQVILEGMSPEQIKSLQDYISQTFTPFSQMEMAELYSQAVGEIGIQPSCFLQMSKQELDWAYDGYIRKKQLEANLGVASINTAKGGYQPIKLIEDKDYEVGTVQERETTFLTLGIEV